MVVLEDNRLGHRKAGKMPFEVEVVDRLMEVVVQLHSMLVYKQGHMMVNMQDCIA